ncbi:MAG: hypothetical protein OSB69_05530 [Alphaproteobacteria bacterium]|nr:hypothetical protein [Alphaproteobacteria bacterium]
MRDTIILSWRPRTGVRRQDGAEAWHDPGGRRLSDRRRYFPHPGLADNFIVTEDGYEQITDYAKVVEDLIIQ